MLSRTSVAALALGALLAGAAEPAEPSDPASGQTPYTAEEKKTFDDLYQDRITKARSRQDRAALAKELMAGVDGVQGGLKYLLLAATKDLAAKGSDLELAAKAQQQTVDLKVGDSKALLAELMDLQLDLFTARGKTAKSLSDAKRTLADLGNRIVENAMTLGRAYRCELDFAAAEQAETKALQPATIIASERLPTLRQTIAISEQLKKLVSMAKGHEARGKTDLAVSEYMDAGLFPEAARLSAGQSDQTAALLIRVATHPAPAEADVLAAAKAWDKRATECKGALETIRLLRAAELYEHYMALGKGLEKDAAKIRLRAISQKLGDLLGLLRAESEWLYLAEMQHESGRVGWGSMKKVTRGNKPAGIAGRAFATAIYVHASSKVVYALRGQYRQLSFAYGMGTGAGGAAWFEVVCDGKSVWKSSGMWSNHTHGVRSATVLSIAGVEKLELLTHGIRGGAGAHSWWGDPKVR
jgi:hypothetical protein